MVGNLYPQGDARRDGAYTIFYMGINLGRLHRAAGLRVAGREPRFGWHYGFGAGGRRDGHRSDLVPDLPEAAGRRLPARPRGGRDSPGLTLDRLGPRRLIGSLALLGRRLRRWPGLAGAPALFRRSSCRRSRSASGSAMLFVFHQGHDDQRTRPRSEDWQRIAVILIVSIFSIVFWMGFEQAGGTLNLFADDKTDRRDLRQRVPRLATSSRSTRFLSSCWPRCSRSSGLALDRTRFRLTSSAKMGLGLILLGLGFVVMYQAEQLAGRGGQGRAAVAVLRLPVLHDRRDLPVADRPVAGQQAGPGEGRLADDGGLVPLHGHRQLLGGDARGVALSIITSISGYS